MALATRPKPPRHHRKASGLHHRKSKHYMKSYWPYLPMLMMVGVGLAINALWSQPTHVLGASNNLSPIALTDATNNVRAQSNETALALDSQLTAAAQAKANDMVARNYWSHISPDGKAPWSFIAASGYTYQLAGENLAYGFDNAKSTVTGWMNSSEHRENILNTSYRDVGFGVASSRNYQGKGPQMVVVALYAEPVDTAATISFTVPEPSATTGTVLGQHTEPKARLVSRIQLMTGGNATWSLFAVSVLSCTALVIFVIRHGVRLHRLINRGELFAVHHPLLDVIIVFVMIAGYVLTRTSGLIR